MSLCPTFGQASLLESLSSQVGYRGAGIVSVMKLCRLVLSKNFFSSFYFLFFKLQKSCLNTCWGNNRDHTVKPVLEESIWHSLIFGSRCDRVKFSIFFIW